MNPRTPAVIALATVLIGWLAPLAAPDSGSGSVETDVAELETRLADLVPGLLEKYKVPGASVAVIIDRKIVMVRGYGNLHAGLDAPPVDEHTVFQAASLSKPVVAYGVHRLVAAGKRDFTLDRPLSDYTTPDEPYDDDDPRLKQITARMVLSHSAGFPNWRPGYWSDERQPLRVTFDPGTRFRYSGEGYVYLQRVVEEITGETLDLYLQRSVLGPLAMSSSSFVWEERFEAVHAAPHDAKGRQGKKWRPRVALAAGTLQTTASDYAAFLLSVLGDGPARDGSWLAPESRIDDRLGWSLGWGYEKADEGNLFWQWGDDGPFKALVAGSRDSGTAVVVFTNGERGLRVARPVVERVLGWSPAFLDYRMLNY